MSIHTDDFGQGGFAQGGFPPDKAPDKLRMISAAPVSRGEEAMERALRPKLLQEYVGQAKAREQLEIFIGAARKRNEDRKSTRLNSSHSQISYAVFCLKKK